MVGSEEKSSGVLTAKQREYLRGDQEFSQNAERMMRMRIRRRIRHALADFALLFRYLEKRDRDQILNKFVNRTDLRQVSIKGAQLPPGAEELEWDLVNPNSIDPVVYTGGIRHSQAFLFLLLQDIISLYEVELSFTDLVETLLQEAIQDTLAKKEISADVSVDISIKNETTVDGEALRKQFEKDHFSLDPQEIQQLIYLRELSFEEMLQYQWGPIHSAIYEALPIVVQTERMDLQELLFEVNKRLEYNLNLKQLANHMEYLIRIIEEDTEYLDIMSIDEEKLHHYLIDFFSRLS